MFWIKELSGREREISVLVAREFTNEQIGEKLDIPDLTVKTHSGGSPLKEFAETRSAFTAVRNL